MATFAGTTFGDITPRVGIFAVANFLAHAQNMLVLERFAKVERVPKNHGLVIKFRRPIPFDASTTALLEGVTPPPQMLKYEDVSSVLQQFGAWVQFTDVISATHEDDNLRAMTQLTGEQAALTKELIVWGVLRGGTSVIFSGAATQRSQVQAPVTLAEFQAAVRVLKNNHAMKITKMIKPGVNISTEPVNASYVAFCHINLEQDLRAIPGFVPVEKYANPNERISEFEIGKVEEVRLLMTPHLEAFFGAGSTTITGVLNNGTNVDVYPIVIVGQEAYGVTPLAGSESVQIAVKNPKMGGDSSDPLGQTGYVAWKMWYAAVRLNEQWMIRIESAASAV